jgi:2-phospho-L-lactate/phosphoenolpyruvate guanylyltransferase
VTIAIVPVKDLDVAKQRLSGRLDKEARRALVLAMLDDVLGALSRASGLSGLMVVTREPEVASHAARFGAELLEEAANDGYTAAVELAVRELSRRRAPSMLSVPGDVPAIETREVDELLSARPPAPSIVLVPSRDERGTNAALVTPPDALTLRFGEPSFLPHFARARELGLRTEVLRLPGLSLDLDTPEDIDAFLTKPTATQTYRLLVGRNGKPPEPPARQGFL